MPGEYFERLHIVLARLIRAGLNIKTVKTFLLQRTVSFLGHLISGDGILAHFVKTAHILGWEHPTCVKDGRTFVGITSYYRKCVSMQIIDANVISPLKALLGINKTLQWTEECENALVTLEQLALLVHH